MQLIDNLVSELGVSNEQAEGGAGLLFQMAKEKLGSDDFSQVSNFIPGIDDLIGKAPAAEAEASQGGIMGAIGGVAESLGLGDIAEKLGGLADLTGGFSKLDLDADMITKFVSLILGFLRENGGEAVEGLLKNVFK